MVSAHESSGLDISRTSGSQPVGDRIRLDVIRLTCKLGFGSALDGGPEALLEAKSVDRCGIVGSFGRVKVHHAHLQDRIASA